MLEKIAVWREQLTEWLAGMFLQPGALLDTVPVEEAEPAEPEAWPYE